MGNGITAPVSVVVRAINIIFAGSGPATASRYFEDCDIHFWLTDAQIADTASLAPTGDYGAIINNALAFLYQKYIPLPSSGGQVPPNNAVASVASFLRLHKTYPHSAGIRLYPGQSLIGDSDTDTKLVRIAGVGSAGDGDGILVLARNGQVNNSNARQATISNICLQGQPTLFNSDGSRQNGLNAEIASINTDPGYSGSSAYNSYIATRVRVLGYSGHGFTAHQSRERPKLAYCFVTGCGTQVAPDSSDWGDGYHYGGSQDIDMAFCAGGGNGGHSVFINGGDTPQIHGGDFWPSKNPGAPDNKRSIFIGASLHFIVDGADINGACEYEGELFNGLPVNIKGRFVNLNFRFREVSFGEGEGGGTAPLDGYIILKKVTGIISQNNVFEPSLDNTGTPDAWPDFIYFFGDNISTIYAKDSLPDFADPLWPAGKALAGDRGTVASICNDMTRCAGLWSQNDLTNAVAKTLFSFTAYAPSTGLIGDAAGGAPPVGTVGEFKSQKIGAGSPPAIATNTPTNVLVLALGAGDFDYKATVQFIGNNSTGSLLEVALSNDADGTQLQMLPPDPTQSAAFGIPFANVTGPLTRLSVWGRINTAGTMVNRHGTVATAQALNVLVTGNGISGFGAIEARRIR